MSDGVILSEEFASQVVRVVRHVLRQERLRQDTGTRHQKHGPAIAACILDGTLAAATDAKTSPGSATATFLVADSGSAAFSEGSYTETVYNHSETLSYGTDTFGFAIKVNGYWRFSGDCAAMASR